VIDLHPSWQSILDSAELIPIPVDASGIPHELATQVQDVTGEDRWLVIAPAAARLHPEFPTVFRRHAGTRRDVGVFYADEVEEASTGENRLQLKPDINVPLLVADDYIGSPVIVLLGVFNRLGGFRAKAGSASVYDFVFRAIRDGVGVARIPVVMVAHEGARPRPRIEDRRIAVTSWIGNAANVLELAPGLTDSSLQLRRRFSSFPEVTLVIPTKQSRPLNADDGSFGTPRIINMLDSLSLTDWPMERLKVLIGDDIADESIYSRSDYPFKIQRVDTRRAPDVPFNYAAKMNALWRQANTEHLVLINDDVVVTGSGWLRALMTFAMNEDVGGVGARLLYVDGTIQHAGMPGGLFGAHAWIFQPADAPTYNDWALVHREWSMVTGAVFATRRSVLELVDGFDEQFSVEFNDTDLCLRLKLLGYKIIYTPFAELLHFEKSSRGDTLPSGDQVAIYLKRWSEFLNNDPAFHPGFPDYSVGITPLPVIGAWYNTSSTAQDR
jgi:O-antigen biosynthesis protein